MKKSCYFSIIFLVFALLFCASCAKKDTLDPSGDNLAPGPSDPGTKPGDPVIKDTQAPVIEGGDKEIFVGEECDYLTLVNVKDDTDSEVQVMVDAAAVEIQTPGVYPIVYTAKDSSGNTSTHTLYLTVVTRETPDTTPPVISGKDVEILQYETVDFASLVSVSDNRDKKPALAFDASAVQMDVPGKYAVSYTATDASGNTAALVITITVLYKDITPPTVTGSDFSITLGDSVSYKKQITVTDDSDPSPKIEIDNSSVDLEKVGVYPVVYTVTDASGNATVLTLQLTVKAKEIIAGANEDYVLMQAQNVLDSITNDSMSKLDIAYAIYRWTKNNIGYVDSSDKTNWIIGAYDGFKTRRGDCYTYFSVSKALLTAAGIDTVDVVKHRTSSTASRHYWLLVNVGDGWYHFDTTRYSFKNANFFMVTDEEIFAWDNKYYKGAHTYLTDGLPTVATKSIQDRVDYNSSTLKY